MIKDEQEQHREAKEMYERFLNELKKYELPIRRGKPVISLELAKKLPPPFPKERACNQ